MILGILGTMTALVVNQFGNDAGDTQQLTIVSTKRKAVTMGDSTNSKTNSAQNLETISADEKKQLNSAEASIRNGLKSYQNVGKALTIIAQGRLYRSTHSTFAKYCKDKWDMTTARASQYQHAYRVHELLAGTGAFGRNLPATESQCRPLVRIPMDEKMDETIIRVWIAVTGSKQKITAKLVNDCVDAELGIDKEPDRDAADDKKQAAADATASGSDGAPNEPSGSAEMRAEMRAMKKRIAYLESQLEMERAAHKRTKASGSAPQSTMAKKLYKAGFRALAKSCHPDNGGSNEAMTELNNIKEALNI